MTDDCEDAESDVSPSSSLSAPYDRVLINVWYCILFSVICRKSIFFFGGVFFFTAEQMTVETSPSTNFSVEVVEVPCTNIFKAGATNPTKKENQQCHFIQCLTPP